VHAGLPVVTAIETGGDLAPMDAAIDALPNRPAVFALWPDAGEPYLSKTAVLRRRLLRLLGAREKPSRLLNLRHTVRRIDYQLTGSAFESGVLLYELTRRYFPDSYLKRLNLRLPPYVNIALSNQFPRSRITTHLTRGPELFFGPFRSRASAERFEGQFLDLFQMRRCQEDLDPSPGHPGCIYGEMGMCVRPCQLVVGPAEYRHEVARVVDFLRTGGRSLLEAIAHSRDRLSEEMMFEEAARQHKRFEKVQETLKLRDELARDVGRLNGVAITRSPAANAVELWFIRDGGWLGARRLDLEVHEGKPVSLDQKLRETIAAVEARAITSGERREYLALLARWFYSTWRDGEWLAFESYGEIPYRKLVNAVSRVAHGETRAE
jgi:excinuclease UvrABC nuclease subunit